MEWPCGDIPVSWSHAMLPSCYSAQVLGDESGHGEVHGLIGCLANMAGERPNEVMYMLWSAFVEGTTTYSTVLPAGNQPTGYSLGKPFHCLLHCTVY